MSRITVIGAGATGLAASAHLTLAGHSLHLLELPEHKQNITALKETKTIRLTGTGQDREVQIEAVSADPEVALKQAELVIVATIAGRHEQVADLCLPLMRTVRAVLITPGNLGSLVLKRHAESLGIDPPLMGEVESNLHVARRSGPTEVELILPPRPRYVSAFPAGSTPSLIEAFSACYELKAAQNVFETTLNHPNVDSHLAGMILNAGLIESPDSEFHFYRDGLGPAALRVMEALYGEKVTVMEAMDLEVRTKIELLQLIQDKTDARFDTFRALPGPQSMEHRFLTEDAFAGMSFLVSLAAQLGIDVPVARSLLHLAVVIGREEYFDEGRTLENLGLDGLSREKMIAYLETGKPEG